MSIYYYFYNDDRHEYFELASGSWYQYFDDLDCVMAGCVRNKRPFYEFVRRLRKQRVFDSYYDDDASFITEDNIKYFLKPLYDWAFEVEDWQLIDDGRLFDEAVRLMCKDKGLEPPKGWIYPPEVEKAIAEFREQEDGIWNHYLKCVGKMDYDDKIMSDIGVSFERALTELKAGATIWRKSQPDIKYYKDKGIGDKDYVFCNNQKHYVFPDLMANDWQYKYKEDKNE